MAALLACAVSAPGARADMADSFRNPPDSAKPQVWWHWMAGNVAREGITADLEAMADVGIGDDFLPEDCTFEPGKQIMERHLNGLPQFILDGKPSPSGKRTFATWKHWTKDDSPIASGMLGPVVLRTVAPSP